MKIFPYYKRTIKSPLTNDSVLNKFENIIREHRTNNFPNNEGFIGGEITDRQFKIFRTGGMTRKPFPLTVTGQSNDNRSWTLTFTTNKWSGIVFLLTFGAMTFVTIKYGTIFFVPVMILSYVIGQVAFNRDSRTLEEIILKEMECI